MRAASTLRPAASAASVEDHLTGCRQWLQRRIQIDKCHNRAPVRSDPLCTPPPVAGEVAHVLAERDASPNAKLTFLKT